MLISISSLKRLLAAASLAVTLAAQYPGRGRAGSAPGGVNNSGQVIDAVATVDGVFKTADKKFVEIQVESGDIMRMYITGKTKFIRDGKAVKSSDFHDGDPVTADASRDVRMNMIAVKIELKRPDEKPKDR
jgi:hypothetical protein